MGRQRGQAAHGLLERDDVLVAHVVAEEAREVAVRARMRAPLQEHALGATAHPSRSRSAPTAARARGGRCPRSSGSTRCSTRVPSSMTRSIAVSSGGCAAHRGDIGERLAGQRLQRLVLEREQQDVAPAPASSNMFSQASVGVRISLRRVARDLRILQPCRSTRRSRLPAPTAASHASRPVAPAVYVYMLAVTRARSRCARLDARDRASSFGQFVRPAALR